MADRDAMGALRRLSVALGCLLLVGCGAKQHVVAGSELRTRVEAWLEKEQDALRESLAHYGLVFEVTPQQLRDFMTRIHPRRHGPDVVMGSAYGIELHGGGVLGLLAEQWRPAGREAELDDRYPFAWEPRPISLADIYHSHCRQLFLPAESSRTGPADAPGAGPQLARMRLPKRVGRRSEMVEVDAYNLLALLLRYEDDLDRSWDNHMDQRLSADLVLRRAWEHYLIPRTASEEFEDHSYLHLPEILLAYSLRAPEHDPNAIKRRFLSVELRRTDFGGYDASEAIGHYVDSLGLLLEDPRVEWSRDERQQVRAWLADLERERFQTLDGVPLEHLAHLLRGLRAIERSASRLH